MLLETRRDKMKTDIRNREITIKVKLTETATDAIDRYMKRNGFVRYDWIDGMGLKHICYGNNEYRELWRGAMMFSDVTNTCTFTVCGDK
jgi:hypothetical protein